MPLQHYKRPQDAVIQIVGQAWGALPARRVAPPVAAINRPPIPPPLTPTPLLAVSDGEDTFLFVISTDESQSLVVLQ